MQEFSFRTQLVLPRKRDEIFRFFADAANLEVLTPPWLRFCVLTPPPIRMHPGTLMYYKLRVPCGAYSTRGEMLHSRAATDKDASWDAHRLQIARAWRFLEMALGNHGVAASN